MFTGTQEFPFVVHLRRSHGGDPASGALDSGMPATVDDGPPVQRLTARQIRSVSAKWKARGRAGDETALRVAEALEWVAERRASEEARAPRSLAGRISAWMGLGESARSR